MLMAQDSIHHRTVTEQSSSQSDQQVLSLAPPVKLWWHINKAAIRWNWRSCLDSDSLGLISVLLLPSIQYPSNRDQCWGLIWHHSLRRPADCSISSGPHSAPSVMKSQHISYMGLPSLHSGPQPPLLSEDLWSVWSTSMWSHITDRSGNALFSKGNAGENPWPYYLLVITLTALKGCWPNKALQWTVEDRAGVAA